MVSFPPNIGYKNYAQENLLSPHTYFQSNLSRHAPSVFHKEYLRINIFQCFNIMKTQTDSQAFAILKIISISNTGAQKLGCPECKPSKQLCKLSKS